MSFDTRILTGVGVLAAVAEAGNFARAADVLGLTPSGVSRAIARLEARIGIRLFDRSPRAVTLTDEGRRFHAQLMPLLASIEEVATDAAGAGATASGKLRINVDPWFARMVLAPRLPEFLARYPRVSIDLLVSNHREDMMTGADVAIRFGPADDGALIVRKLLDTRILTCAAPDYLDRHGTPQRPHDLLHHEALLFRDPQTGRPFEWEFSKDGEAIDVDVRGRLATDDPSTAIAACVSGHGIFQSLALGLDAWLRGGELVQILPEWSAERYPLHAYLHSRRLPPAKVRVFLDFIVETVAASAA
jgi:DNA-binding transcriptional LysR family regulator